MTDDFAKMFKTMMDQGQDMIRAFNPGIEGKTAADGVFPTMSKDMMEMWFGKTFNQDGLDAKTRLFITLTALTVQGALAEPQIKLTVRHALEAGATQREITEVIGQCAMFGGLPAMQKALEAAQAVFAETKEAKP